MKTVLMLATTAAMIEQFNKNNILILEEMGYEVHVAGNFLVGNPISDKRLEEFKLWIEEHHGKWFHIPATRKPTDLKNNIAAYKNVLQLIREYHYDFIHCHTPIGSVIGRLAAHKTHTRIIYTAHGFHFFKGAPLINWIFYYPVERFLSRWTDMLILINKEDYNRAKKSFHAKRTECIPGVGVDVEKIFQVKVDREEKRRSIGVPEDAFLIISVGEVNKNKNHAVIVRAIAQLKQDNIHYVICGQGGEKDNLIQLSKELGIQERVHLLGFRNDVIELLKSSDLFAFPSKREGLGLAAIEAMAVGLPLITSGIHGIKDYSIDTVTGYKILDDSPVSYAEAIMKIAFEEKKGNKYARINRELSQKYDINTTGKIMKELYLL
uniref:glycosyltransferase n=1 Tax=Acetatifactor sp. TaxID=1872090 RepID=UPI004055F160